MEFTLVTTFSYNGYKEYGKKFIDSYKKFNSSTPLTVVFDEEELLCLKNKNIELIKNRFIDKNLQILKNSLYINRDNYFIYDAFKFSWKPTAIYTLISKKNIIFKRYLVWIDGDTIFLRKNIEYLLHKIKPKKGQFCSVFDREYSKRYLEAGLIIFDLNDSRSRDLIRDVSNCFTSQDVFNYDEWHDAYIFTEFLKKYSHEVRRISQEYNLKYTHPISQWSITNKYLDHLKGSRKTYGFSPEKYPKVGKWLIFFKKITSLLQRKIVSFFKL